MTGVLLGLVLGAGVFCVWWSFWPRDPRPPRVPSPWRRALSDDLRQAGIDGVSPLALVAASLAAGLLVFLLVVGVTSVAALAACFAAMAVAAPMLFVRSRARRRRAALRDVWPEVVDNLASAVRAGLSLPEALSQLGSRGPEFLRPAFSAFAEDYRASGRFQDFVESLRIAREVGGSDLGRLLRTLSAFLRQDARTRSELETRQGWTVNAARLAVAAPWIVLALLATRPESIAAYDRPAGAAVLVGGAVVTVVAYQLMVRIARLPDEQRVLR